MAKRVIHRGRVSLKRLSMDALQAEIKRRRRATGPLMRKRNKLLARIAKIDAALGNSPTAAASNGSPRRGRTRPKNGLTLVEALRAAMKGRTMGIQEAIDAVQRAGYRSNAKNFKVVVGLAFFKNKKVFNRVGRGRYRAG